MLFVVFVVASQSLTKNWRKKIAKKQISKFFEPDEVFRPKKESESYPEIKIKSFQLKTISNKFKSEGNTHFNKNHFVKKQKSKRFFDPFVECIYRMHVCMGTGGYVWGQEVSGNERTD